MTKRSTLIALITIIGIILIITLVILFLGRNNTDPDDDFVREYLIYLDEGASDIYFLEATLYFGDDDAFLEINYDYSYLNIERRTRYLVNRYTGQVVNGGYEENFPDFMNSFNDTKTNYISKKVYSISDINQLLDK
jgi:hypothetical protein